jgi:CHAT domain-containing protein
MPGGIMPGAIRFDKDFTRQALFDGVQGGYPVVHLSTHFSWKQGQEGSFLLLGDGPLRLGEIRNRSCLFCEVDLLTLSACNTATSDTDNGKEVEGLGFVAQQLGAKAVIASLWAVSDTGTDELMLRFYRQRQAKPKLPKAEAFRQAQLSLLRGDAAGNTAPGPARAEIIGIDGKPAYPLYQRGSQPPFAHPHYWSSFILIGNWR